MLTRGLVLLTFVLAACNPPPVSVAEAAGGVAPLGTLSGVYLGMTARALARVRPAARPVGYTGYGEDVSGFHVAYEIPGSYSEEQVVSPRARVLGVSAGRIVAGIDSGMIEWRRNLRTASMKLKSLPLCFRVATQSGVTGLEAEWKHTGSSFTSSLYETPETRGEGYTVRLGLVVARKASRAGAPNGRSRIDCNGELSGMWRGRPR
jgi:hypothetical protein